MKSKSLTDRLKRLEIKLITRALKTAQFNRSHAATILGINRTSLVEKMRRYGFPLHAAYTKRPSWHKCHTFYDREKGLVCTYCNQTKGIKC